MTSQHVVAADRDGHFKDAVLDKLAERANAAQFVSFAPHDAAVRYVRLSKTVAIHDLESAIFSLFDCSAESTVNVRSFDPAQPKSHEFIYGISEASLAIREIRRLAAQGLYTIANETIDVSDGGVSGVAYGGVVEFAPDDTPRCVDKPGTASLPRNTALRILKIVYGFEPALDYTIDQRVEFSIHPLRRGVRRGHTIIWELERFDELELTPAVAWPNRFSRHVGDKVFGLLMAESIGLKVPATRVFARRVAPFSFGEPTRTNETWLRTAPLEQVPGHFTTVRGWRDPFELVRQEDPSGQHLSAVMSQDGVDARFSGAAACTDKQIIVEGVRGNGDDFMLGKAGPEPLPSEVVDDVSTCVRTAATHLGPVRLEWVHDGADTWIVQLHAGATQSVGLTIYPGNVKSEHRFPVARGLSALRELASQLQGTGDGIVIVGRVGVTSHVGDVLRRARIPSRIEPPEEAQAEQLSAT